MSLMRGKIGLRTGAALLIGLAFATGASAAGIYQISQKGRAFQPGAIAIARGDVLQIVNDDGDLLHHAYVASDEFNFDSGEQEPGSSVSIRFPQSGRFSVLCGIHPKMRLTVQVQ